MVRKLNTEVPTVKITKTIAEKNTGKGESVTNAVSDEHDDNKEKNADEEEEEMEDMFVMGPAGVEWGGPTRGGRRPEPTRFGDWEQKGRATDF